MEWCEMYHAFNFQFNFTLSYSQIVFCIAHDMQFRAGIYCYQFGKNINEQICYPWKQFWNPLTFLDTYAERYQGIPQHMYLIVW